MHASYLIDGYNLIHALGMIQRQMGPGGLEASRRRLLEFLAEAFGSESSRVTIIFDAKGAPGGLKRIQTHGGLHIHFAPRNQSADDLIETLIEADANPAALTVVSNDHRLQDAARRHGGQAWAHEDLLDFLEKRQTITKSAPPEDEKSERVSPAEMKRWLKEFEPLERDPELKEFFDMDKFED